MNIVARPWEPQDLIDDLQLLIDEEPDNYLNFRRTTMCMARDYLKEHFAEPRWIPVTERLPEKKGMYLVHEKAFNKWGGYMNVVCFSPCYDGVEEHLKGRKMWYDYDSEWGDFEIRNVTHWMPLPEPPKEEV